MDDVAVDATLPERRLHPWSWLFVLLQQLKQFIFPLVALLVFGARKGDDDLWISLAPFIGIVVLVALAIRSLPAAARPRFQYRAADNPRFLAALRRRESPPAPTIGSGAIDVCEMPLETRRQP